MKIRLKVNGEKRLIEEIWTGESLMYVLRERLGLAGAKNACEQGACGACAVHFEGLLVYSCMILAGQAQDCEIMTVEGLAPVQDELHPIQQAFVEAGAIQCGFCTPGLIVATHDLLMRNPTPSELEVREALVGHLCRCTGYQKIIDAVLSAGERLEAIT